MVLTLLNKTKVKKHKFSKLDYPGPYYYNRIERYAEMQAEAPAVNQKVVKHIFWEGVLFDLKMLTPRYTVQVKSFSTTSARDFTRTLSQLIVKAMLRRNVLRVNEEDRGRFMFLPVVARRN